MTAQRRSSVPPVELETEVVYAVLGNPNKRKIIDYLGRNGRAGFTELRRALKMSVGNLYYNLDKLAGFVYQDEDRKYALTEAGKLLYKILVEETKRLDHMLKPKSPLIAVYRKYVEPVVVPAALFTALYNRRLAAAALASISVALAAIGTYTSNLCLCILEYSVYPPAWISAILEGRLQFFSSVVLSWLVVALFIDGATYALGSREKRRIELYASALFSLAPIIAYSLLHQLVPLPLLKAVSLRILQVGTLGLLTASTSVYADLSKDRAFIAVFLLFYISYALHLATPAGV